MDIISNSFEDGRDIPIKYTCEGDGISPHLQIKDVPKNAISLALLVWDMDVPLSAGTNGNWDHWIVFNINPNTKNIEEGIEPEGIHGITTSDTYKYVPPCPPDKEHRYFFKIYALDMMLDLNKTATRSDVEKAIIGHILAEVQIMGKYCKEINK